MIHIVFDLDGTLADTQDVHQTIESNFLSSKWVSIAPNDIWKSYAGRSPSEWIPECLYAHWVSFQVAEVIEFIESKDKKVIELLHKWEIQLIPWVREVLEYFHGKGYLMGISSWACREFIDDFVNYFWLTMILASTSANEVVNKKPAPDVFLSTFSKLEAISGIPDQKWVIGDWKTDIIGGNASHAKTILCYHDFQIPYSYRIDRFPELISIIH